MEGMTVALKANFNSANLSPASTHPDTLRALVQELWGMGARSLCTQRKVFGSGVDGALQEYVAVPADRVFPLPPGLLPKEGSLITQPG